METLLEVRGLKKYFPMARGLLKCVVGWVKAVDDVSFAVAPARSLAWWARAAAGNRRSAKRSWACTSPPLEKYASRDAPLVAYRQRRRGVCGATSSMSIRTQVPPSIPGGPLGAAFVSRWWCIWHCHVQTFVDASKRSLPPWGWSPTICSAIRMSSVAASNAAWRWRARWYSARV
jgi:hypothetical protein